VSAAIYGIAYGGAFPVVNVIVTESFGGKQLGTVFGVISVVSGIGSLVGPWLAGYVFDHTGSYSIAFLAAAGCSMIAVALAVPFSKQPSKLSVKQS
jgi:MFS family permease